MRSFSIRDLDELTCKAVKSSRLRQHLNLHESYIETCQRLLNAIEPDSYIRPHSHSHDQGAETIFALRGLMALICFDEAGNVLSVKRFGAGNYHKERDVSLGVEIPPGIWHTVVALEHGSVLLEIKGGPFNPESPKFPALWAPEEGSELSSDYLSSLKKSCGLEIHD